LQYSSAGLTGNSAEQTLVTYTLTGGILKAGRGVRITARWKQTGATSTAYKLYFGTALASKSSTNSAQQFSQWEAVVFNKPAVTNAQVIARSVIYDGNTVAQTGLTDPSVDTASDVVIKLTFNVANTVTVTEVVMSVELI
jgi:hypothetical protein